MADYKFLEFIFEPESTGPAELIFEPGSTSLERFFPKFKAAYSSLTRKPQQLFALLVEKEICIKFLSGFPSYGKKLASLLDKFPRYFPAPPEDQWGSKKDDYNPGLLAETLRAFLFSLLAEDLAEIESQEALADIIMAVIKLSKPEALGLLGEKLGETPIILTRLIANSRIGDLSHENHTLFRSITSNATTFETWSRIVVDLARKCTYHRSFCRYMVGVEGLREVICSFRNCLDCQVPSSHEELESDDELRLERDDFLGFDLNLRTFRSLLGSHLGNWKIVLSAQALKDLTESVDSGDFAPIKEKILKIAAGEWMPRSLIKPVKSYRVPVFKTFYKANSVILWQVDVAFDERHYQNCQVVKVWGIGTHGEIAHIRDHIIRTQQAYTKDKTDACKTNNPAKLEGVEMPMYVDLAHVPSRDKQEQRFNDATGCEVIESSPMLAKFYSLTSTVLDTISSGAPVAIFPLDVSAEEVHIIDHFQTPAFILGRSGTGKTTCLIYKLASRYLSSKKIEESPVRQLLLTRSKDLVKKLKRYTKLLIDTQVGRTDVDTQAAEDDNVYTWDDAEEDTNRGILSLNEQDFPLVCTFNYFLRLLENSVRAGGRENLRLIDSTTFRIDYWRRFPARMTKGISVDLAFVEIMGTIKGSISFASNLKPLSRDEYLNSRWRLAPSFATSGERDAVYSLYEKYECMKKARGEIDNMDRVIHVIKALNEDPELQRRVERLLDEVYVDEVQDQRPLEIELLLSLIRNPRGIHFAGDTAQSISKDALFRFANAKALFYTRFSKLEYITGDKSTLIKPSLLPLSQNFRSHQGILYLASFVMKILYTGFPNSVDKLPREVGELHGPKPTLCVFSDPLALLQETAKLEAASEVKRDSEAPEFGEERVIIVRDKQTQDELREELEGFALVLTILQSKGMEFEDVFLYNFFTASSKSHNSDFATLEKLLYERHFTGSEGEPRRHADWEKAHIALCSELKNLYVGVTRVRSRLWVLESKSNTVDSAISLFNKTAHKLFPKKFPKELVEVVWEHEPEAAGLQERFRSTKKTNPARWRELAYEFMSNKNFHEAKFCFRKASDSKGEMLAQAYLEELRGMEYRASGFQEESTLAFKEACAWFLKIDRTAKAAGCLETIGNFADAAEIWSQNGQYAEAALLFIRARWHERAADEYHKLGKHEKALATYFNGSRFDTLVRYLNINRAEVSPTCYTQYSRLCYRLLTEERVAVELRAIVLTSLGSGAQQEQFSRKLGMMNDVFWLYNKQQRYKEAYEICVSIGFLEDALRLLIDHRQLEWVPPPNLAEIFNYLRVGDALVKIFRLKGDGQATLSSHVTADLATSGLMNDQLLSIDKSCKALEMALNGYPQPGVKPNRDQLKNEQMSVLFDLLVTSMASELGVKTTDVTKLPLESIHGTIEILSTIISKPILPYQVRLYLGIFEIGNRPLNYTPLWWSPLHPDRRLRCPIEILGSDTARDRGYKQVLNIISQAIASIEGNSRGPWKQLISTQFEDYPIDQGYCTPNGVPEDKSSKALESSRFGTNLQSLLSLNLVFSDLKSILPVSRITGGNKDIMLSWPFWQKIFIHQMTFVSSYEQDARILLDSKRKLTSTSSKLETLYGQLQKFHLSEMQKFYRSAENFSPHMRQRYLSSLLQQMQVAEFLGIGYDSCSRIMEGGVRSRDDQELTLAFDVAILAQKTRVKINQGDFPGCFCENVHKLLSLLKKIQDRTNQLSCYCAPVLSLYEEIVVLLIFLIRPTEFLIPQSWAHLHLPKWAKIPRSRSRREICWYQRLLCKVVISFCKLVRKTEDLGFGESKKPTSLARRSLDLLVISIINIGTLKPLPSRYSKMWSEAQKVFGCDSLRTENIRGIPAQGLVGRLVQAFTFYNGKDLLWAIVTEGADLPELFAKHRIATIKCKEMPKRARHLELSSPDLESRKINAAYIITQCWRTNGLRFLLRKVKVKAA